MASFYIKGVGNGLILYKGGRKVGAKIHIRALAEMESLGLVNPGSTFFLRLLVFGLARGEVEGTGHFWGEEDVIFRASGSFVAPDDAFDEGMVLKLLERSLYLAV